MYKIIACDLDETLLDTNNRKVCQRNRDAIRKAKELGVKFVVATGRGYRSVHGTLQELGLFEQPNEYVISFNGGAITENVDEKILHFQGISFEVAEELFRRSKMYDVCTHVYTRDTVYGFDLWRDEKRFLKGRMAIVDCKEESLDFLRGQDIMKVLYMNPDRPYLQKIDAELADVTAGMDISYSSNRYLEFNHAGVNKGAGLIKLADLLGVKMEEVIAIGDNMNDLSMMKVAGLGVAVANAVDDVKPYCQYVTEAHCNDGAVAEVIEKFVLNAN